jgi:hypothetical protein
MTMPQVKFDYDPKLQIDSDECPEDDIFTTWRKQSKEDKEDIQRNIDCFNVVGEGKFITPPDFSEDNREINYDSDIIYQDCEYHGIVNCYNETYQDSENKCPAGENSSCVFLNDDQISSQQPDDRERSNGDPYTCVFREDDYPYLSVRQQCSNIPQGKKQTTGKRKEGGKIPAWWSLQKDANPKKEFVKDEYGEWSEGGKRHRKLWKGYNGSPLKDNKEFLRLIGGEKVLKKYTSDGDTNKRIKQLKADINSTRGALVQCKDMDSKHLTKGTEWGNCNQSMEKDGEMVATFGPEDLIIEEVRDWINDVVIKDDKTGDMASCSNNFFLPKYEKCMNDLLYIGGFEDEEEIIKKIKSYKSFMEWGSRDREYLLLKMKKLAYLKPETSHECMEHLELGARCNEELCKTGVSVKINQLAHLVVQVMGFSLDFEDVKVDSQEYRELIRFIDELIPILPDIIKNIIDISEYYEKKNCPSGKNINTELLKRIYVDLFEKGQDHTFDLNVTYNFEDIKEMDIYELMKLVLIILVGTYVFSTIIHSLAELIGIFKSAPIKK